MKFSTPQAIVIASIVIAAGLFFGLKSTPSSKSQVLGETQQPTPSPKPQIVSISIDDDPILGDKDSATVAIVEFSDYECPYCKSFRNETLDLIKQNYIDTGQVILVYRDLPLTFHNPAAQREALAAECVQDLGGDQAYFSFHDLIFATTPGNGIGVNPDELAGLAQKAGVNPAQFQDCLDSNKFKEEIEKDVQDAASVGIGGTPGFVIGNLEPDGLVSGSLVSGAQPYAVFQATIEHYLP